MYVFELATFPGAPITQMIEEGKPQPLSDSLYRWYGFLFAMAVRGPVLRWASRFIHRNGLFKSNSTVFNILLYSIYGIERANKWMAKAFLKARR